MKRTEIAVGDELYHALPSDWRDGGTSNPGRRVRVLSTEPHSRASFGGAPKPSAKAPGILVEVLHEKTGEPRTFRSGTGYVVQLAHLRGPYAATLEAVEKLNVARIAARRTEYAQREALNNAITEIADQARRDWPSVQMEKPWSAIDRRDVRVSVSLADFERMLATLAELGDAAQDLVGERDAEGV